MLQSIVSELKSHNIIINQNKSNQKIKYTTSSKYYKFNNNIIEVPYEDTNDNFKYQEITISPLFIKSDKKINYLKISASNKLINVLPLDFLNNLYHFENNDKFYYYQIPSKLLMGNGLNILIHNMFSNTYVKFELICDNICNASLCLLYKYYPKIVNFFYNNTTYRLMKNIVFHLDF